MLMSVVIFNENVVATILIAYSVFHMKMTNLKGHNTNAVCF